MSDPTTVMTGDTKQPGAPRRILILGGAGFLGANLVRRVLREPNVELTVVDSLDPALLSTEANLAAVAGKVTFIQGDIRDEKMLAEVIPGQELIFNCAAQTSHPRSLENPIFDTEVNCIGNLKVLTAVRDLNPNAVIVYPSSSTVVGKAVGDMIDEAHAEKPLDIYSANKGVVEKYYRVYNRLYDLKTVVIRFANLYGPFGKYDPAFGFVNYFINHVAAGQNIQIFGDGEQTRNVMFADDAADIMWLAAHTPALIGETYFATHFQHHSVKEIAETIISVFGIGAIAYVPWPDVRKRIEIEKVMFSSARLHYLTGWKPKYSLREGLELTKDRMAGRY